MSLHISYQSSPVLRTIIGDTQSSEYATVEEARGAFTESNSVMPVSEQCVRLWQKKVQRQLSPDVTPAPTPEDPIIMLGVPKDHKASVLVINPFEDIECTNKKEKEKEDQNKTMAYYAMTLAEYQRLCNENILVMEKINWREVGVTTFGDTAWQAGSMYVPANLTMDHPTFYPLMLGFVLCALLDLSVRYTQFKKEHNRNPSKQETYAMGKKSAALGFKLGLAMGGWELGSFVAGLITAAVHVTPQGLLASLIAVVAIGIFCGIAGLIGSFFDRNMTWNQRFKLMCACCVSGMVWYIATLIPMGKMALTVLCTLFGTLLTFAQLGPKEQLKILNPLEVFEKYSKQPQPVIQSLKKIEPPTM